MTQLLAACLFLATWLRGAAAHAADALLVYDANVAPVAFAADELDAALRARGYATQHRSFEREPERPAQAQRAAPAAPAAPSLRVRFMTRERALRREPAGTATAQALRGMRAEGFTLLQTGSEQARELWVVGADVAGQMYGGLELAEQIRLFGVEGVKPLTQSPHMALRGMKFNLPLDVRTPSYTDMSDSAQAAIGTVWDFEFWRAYLDQLARHRYNLVSLWNEHPFPSMVRVPEYPDVALADVWRSKIAFEEDYPTSGTGLATPAMLARVEVLQKLTIDQKIAFWRRVMQYAKDRNIELCLVTWNIFTYGTGGKYGITDALDNPTTVDYFRASVRALFRTYPLLRGIGLTTGENMGDASFEAKERWAFDTYGQGTLDAARAEPTRQFRFIHRQHQTRAQDIASTFEPLVKSPNVDFVFSFKYAQAHVLSSTRQTFHAGYLESLGALKTLWTLRNDDALMFRWAAPDFVRQFVQNIPVEKSAGYYFGSDMWVWAREFIDKRPQAPRQLEVDKHWLHFLLWGRLGYEPTLGNERIVALVQQRFPGIDAAKLLDAWQQASLIYPLVTGFHWGEFDFQWYIEGCRSRPGPAQTASGFHDVNRFITLGVHPGTDNIPIPRYVENVLRGEPLPGTTPLQVADQIAAHADAALATLSAWAPVAPNRGGDELRKTLGDIRAMALLGQYYAAKIRGATQLALYRSSGDPAQQRRAIEALTNAARAWRSYTAQASSQYRNPLWTNRVGIVDWAELTREVDEDIAIARQHVEVPRK
ncbi:MAG TPA: hypothetical protein VNN80_36160 [Polyangiaceae bacterium]|nr:hypothetical protein [Polyangiaceae bacterium]